MSACAFRTKPRLTAEQAVRSQIAEAQKIATGSGSEADVAEAKIELEVLESLQAALK